MGLIGVSYVCRQLRKAPLMASATGKMQQALEPQNGLERFRPVSHTRRETALKLAAADANPAAQLSYPAIRMVRQPLDGCVHDPIAGCGIRQEVDQRGFKCRSSRTEICLLGNSLE